MWSIECGVQFVMNDVLLPLYEKKVTVIYTKKERMFLQRSNIAFTQAERQQKKTLQNDNCILSLMIFKFSIHLQLFVWVIDKYCKLLIGSD